MLSPFWQNVLISFLTGGGFAAVLGLIQYKIKRKDDSEDKKAAQSDKTDEIAEMVKELVKELIAWKDSQTELSKNQSEMILGLAHDRIVYLGSKYLQAGEITVQELDDFNQYLYEPYAKLGGNGTGEKIWNRVNALPVREPERRKDE